MLIVDDFFICEASPWKFSDEQRKTGREKWRKMKMNLSGLGGGKGKNR
jgi:hypothetical protein